MIMFKWAFLMASKHKSGDVKEAPESKAGKDRLTLLHIEKGQQHIEKLSLLGFSTMPGSRRPSQP